MKAALERREELRCETALTSPLWETRRDCLNRLRDAIVRRMPLAMRERIIDDEVRAWRFGRDALVEVGCREFEEYDRREREGLRLTRVELGMEEPTPEDLRDNTTDVPSPSA